MRAWVEIEDYVGPCRRMARAALRLFDRRKFALAGPEPSVATAVRRLRLKTGAIAEAETREFFLIQLSAAADLADAHGYQTCARDVREAQHFVTACAGSEADLEEVERLLSSALYNAEA